MKLSTLALALVLLIASPLQATELPADTQENIVALTINGKAMASTVIVPFNDEDYFFTYEQMVQWGIHVDEFEGYKSATSLGLTPILNSETQALDLQTPASLLGKQTFARHSNFPTAISPSPKGVMLSYDLATRYQDGWQGISMGNTATMGLATGTLTSTGQVNYRQDKVEFIRGVTTWQKDILDKGVVVQLGDVFTSRNDLASSVNLAGIRIASDPELRGGRQHAIPIIGGLADTRSTAEIYINAVKRQQEGLDQGPFEFHQLPLVDGHNHVELIIHDEFGRTQSFSRDLYVSRSNLPKGVKEWSISAGAIRASRSSDAYQGLGMDAHFEMGITDRWTSGAHLQATQDAKALTWTNSLNLGVVGSLTADLSTSQSPIGDGHAYSLGWEKRTRNWTARASHTKHSDDYWMLNDEVSLSNLKVNDATTASLSFHPKDSRWGGTLSYTDMSYGTGRSTQRADLALRFNQSPSSSWALSVGHNLETKENQLALSYRYSPRGSSRSLATSFRDTGNERRLTASYNDTYHLGNQPISTSSSLAHSDRRGESLSMSARSNFDKAHVSMDAYISNDSQTLAARAAGSVWLGEGGPVLAAPNHNAFIVAHVPGQEGIPVSGGGKPILTNKKGYAVIPRAAPLREQQVRIDPSAIPIDQQVEKVQQSVATPRRGGAKVVFEVSKEQIREFVLTVDGTHPSAPTTASTDAEMAVIGNGGVVTLLKATPGQSITINTQSPCTTTLPNDLGTVFDRIEVHCQTEGL